MGSLKCVIIERTLNYFFFKNLELFLKGRKLRKMKLKAKSIGMHFVRSYWVFDR